MSALIPKSIDILGISFPPLILTMLSALILTTLIATLLNRTGISRHLYYPAALFLAIFTILTVLIGNHLIPF